MTPRRYSLVMRTLVLLGCAVFGVAAAAAGRRSQRTGALRTQAARPRTPPAQSAADSTARRAATARQALSATGDRTIILFIGSNACAGSNRAGFVPAVRAILDSMQARARRDSTVRVSTVGVSLDPTVEEGLTYLKKYGTFDQLSVGESWINDAAVRYVWRDVRGSASIPQMVVIKRHVAYAPDGITVGPDSLIARKLGSDEIFKWARTGVRLP